MQYHASMHTESNVIDLTVLPDQSSIIYSMDNSHQNSSTSAAADNVKSNTRSLMGSVSYCIDSGTWKANEPLQADLAIAMRACADSTPHVTQARVAKGKSLTELLYGMESLRKRETENETDV